MEHAPTFATPHGLTSIRVYPDDYAGTDTESDVEPTLEWEHDEEEEVAVADRLAQNQQFMDNVLPTWVLLPQTWLSGSGTNVLLVRRPTASNMVHHLLHPGVYKGIQSIPTLDAFANLVGAPRDWEEKYNMALASRGTLLRNLNHFARLRDNARESNIQSVLIGLVTLLADALGTFVAQDTERMVIVGGILAHSEYDVRSRTDAYFQNEVGIPLLATEVKTNRTFPEREMWYHGSRGVEVLSAMYAYHCPTMIVTQKQFKVFVENAERNAIFTYPYDTNQEHTNHVNASLLQPVGTTMLNVIAICMLSQPRSLVVHPFGAGGDLQTPPQKVIKKKHWETLGKPLRMSPRLAAMGTKATSAPRRTPKFISGYLEGKPVYTEVRVVSDESVQTIESRIQELDAAENLKQRQTNSFQSEAISRSV
jgi:hypothetical protein